MIAVAGAVAPVAASARVPRVVIVVGPVGSLTSYYRGLANEAAAEAAVGRAPQVTKVYSPNATWPAVRHALEGASIVVYLGHGNGWPSPYRDALYPPTQNGFGLNPVAGGDDSAHQYFGESSVDNVKLAPNAVVVLSHLCYASGNSEPGLAEGTQATADPAGRQLRGRLHPRRGAGRRRRGPPRTRLLRPVAAPQPALDRADLARARPTTTATRSRSRASARTASPSASTRTAPAAASTARSCRGASARARSGRARPARRRSRLVGHPAAGDALARVAGPHVRAGQHPVAADRGDREQRRPGRAERQEGPRGTRSASAGTRSCSTRAGSPSAASPPRRSRHRVALDPAARRHSAVAAHGDATPTPARRRPRRPRAARLGRDARPRPADGKRPERRRDLPVRARPVPARHDAPHGAGIAYDAPDPVDAHLGPSSTSAAPYSAAFGAPSALALPAGATSTLGVRVVNAGSQGWDAESRDAAGRAGLAPDLAADVADRGARRRRPGCRPRVCRSRRRLGGPRSQGVGARRHRRRSRSTSSPRSHAGRLPAAARRRHADARRPVDAGQHPGAHPRVVPGPTVAPSQAPAPLGRNAP